MTEHSSSSSGDRAVRYTRCARADHTDDEELEQIAIGDSRSMSRSRSQSRDNNTTTDGDQSETELTSLVVNGPLSATFPVCFASVVRSDSFSSGRSRTASTKFVGASINDEDGSGQSCRLIDHTVAAYEPNNSSAPSSYSASASDPISSGGPHPPLQVTAGKRFTRLPGHHTNVERMTTVTDVACDKGTRRNQTQAVSDKSTARKPSSSGQQPLVSLGPADDQNSTSKIRRTAPDHSTSRLSTTSGPNAGRSDTLGHWSMGGVFGGYVNRGHTIEPTTPRHVRRQRRKEIARTFGGGVGKRRNDTLSGTGCGMGTGAASLGGGSGDGSSTTGVKEKGKCCRSSIVFDPAGRLAYWWSFVVSIAFIYNFWVLVYRFAFHEIDRDSIGVWFALDYTADLLYALDIAFNFRTGYLDDGVLQTDTTKLRIHYMNSTLFYVDLLSLLPLDFLYLSIGFQSMLRCFRLVKIYRFWTFLDRTERHTNFPNVVRTVALLHYLFAVYHWNACLLHTVTKNMHNYRDEWSTTPSRSASPPVPHSPLPNTTADDEDMFGTYLRSLYWSTLVLTTIGGLPVPVSKEEYVFVIVEFVFGLLLFATILGHVANIVTSISAARKEFQAKLDSVKTYMMLRRVPLRLQDRVIKWFDYLWLSKKSSDEEKTLSLLPNKLKAEIALHVHLDTLKRVEIFQNTEAGFLCDLVLRLRPVLFSPGDYICRKGEVGKDMYIVNRGRLQVVADNGKTVLATLRPGSYFGEISILNMGNAGNRRTASVRSVGYSDLFCLSKNDLWEVLKDYPTARVRLEAIAIKRLEKYKKAPLEQENAKGSRMFMVHGSYLSFVADDENVIFIGQADATASSTSTQVV